MLQARCCKHAAASTLLRSRSKPTADEEVRYVTIELPVDGGESFRHFHERIASGVESLLSDHHRVEIHDEGEIRLWQLPPGEPRLLIVAHEGTNAALLSHLLGLEPVPWSWMRFSSAWTGISRLRSLSFPSGAVWAVDFFNRTEHLTTLEAGIGGNSR